jgi:hypothetical protein
MSSSVPVVVDVVANFCNRDQFSSKMWWEIRSLGLAFDWSGWRVLGGTDSPT